MTTNGASTTIGPVTITPDVPQPAVTSSLGGSEARRSTRSRATSPPAPPTRRSRGSARRWRSTGPTTAWTRGRAGRSGRAGRAWLDTPVIPDNDGSGNVIVALPDGQQMRFGYNATTATYAPPMGSPDVLIHNSGGTWTLMDSSGNQYEYTSAGQLEQITDAQGLTQEFTSNSAGEITTITDTASGRTLTLTWSTPTGAAYPHVVSVTTNPPASGQRRPGLELQLYRRRPHRRVRADRAGAPPTPTAPARTTAPGCLTPVPVTTGSSARPPGRPAPPTRWTPTSAPPAAATPT